MSKSSYPSRFIINTDYATLKNDATGTAILTVPSSANTTIGGADIVYRSKIQIGASQSAGYRFYVTSSKYNYAITTPFFYMDCTLNGYDSQFPGCVYREGNSFVLEVTFPANDYDVNNYTNSGQTLTLHIQSFIDPFDS